jgi:hypothetical protein
MTTKDITELFAPVASAMYDAHLVAYDGCHKIYLAMDEVEAEWFRQNYEYWLEAGIDEMLATVTMWYEESCFLRFVSAVRYNPDDPNAGFTNLIAQFADQEDDDEDDEDDE